MLRTVVAFQEPWEAHMFCSRLEAEGVPAFVVHECHIGNAWHYSTALGGVKVQVSDERREDAKRVANACWSGEFQSLLEDQFGSLADIHCPNCGSVEHRKRRPIPRAVMAVTLSGLFGVLLPPIGWLYVCNQCGAKFKQPLCPLTLGKSAILLTALASALGLVLALELCAWGLGSRYWVFVVVAIIILAGRLMTCRSSADGDKD